MPDQNQETVLRFENVSIAFEGVPALQKVSFKVTAGETRIILGAAGSGKSVLLKVAMGLLQPDEGEVYMFGNEISRLEEDELYEIRSKIGVLFQEGGLFDSLTVEENVAYPLLNQRTAAERRKPPQPGGVENRVREALRFVELEHTLDKFPSELSGGMRRRVGIARAAVTEPPLMFYDSPTAGLDPITANTIMALIAKARDTRNTTSMIVTHRYQDGDIMANFRYNPEGGQLEPAPAENTIHERTRFMVFAEGKLVFEGTQEDLEQAQDTYVAKFKAAKH